MAVDWKPVSRTAAFVGAGAAGLFWLHALTSESGFLLLDYANLAVHEAGHVIFSLFGLGLGVWGGTLLQLLMPLAFAVHFARRGETLGTAFGAFWAGENGLNIARYIADARAQALPLVGGGEHDWNFILGRLGLLEADTKIAAAVRVAGWAAMILAVVWVVLRSKKDAAAGRGAGSED
ncbi:MAG: hypothetical protein FJY80_13330 [Candidatus Aminicenantes bacterium]|nr:hypothetical protein [Candidatus Aminicenantes bacterium]